MPTSAGPNIAGESNIVFAYDTGDTSNSYRGQPTTNTMRQSNNVTGTQYGYNNEYDTCQLVKTWNASLKTPVGTGATLLTEQNSGNSPWYGLNWYDESEDGKRCLSAYIYPVNSVTQLRFGMVGDSGNSVFFNLVTRAITYGAGISNTNAFIQDVPGYPGWLRVGANIEGRSGGWVAFLGTGFESYYTPSTPYQSFYVCGIQYERNIAPHCTQFTPAETTRSATQGLLPLISNTSLNISTVSFNSNAQIVFDGTDDYINAGSIQPFTLSSRTATWETVVKFGTSSGAHAIATKWNNSTGQIWWFGRYPTTKIHIAMIINGNYYAYYSDGDLSSTSNYYHIVVTLNDTILSYYINGVLDSTDTVAAGTWATDNGNPDLIIGAQNAGTAANFNGNIPILKMYNTALSADQVKQNYQQYKSRFNLS